MNAFVYPMKNVDLLKRENPYLSRFANAINSQFPVLNMGETTRGFLNVFTYIFRCDLFFLNWIENLKWYNLPFFYVFLIIVKISGKRIIWTHHNVQPHGGQSFSSSFIFNMLGKFSHKILIHTKESLKIIPPKYHSKCIYILHPYFDKIRFKDSLEKYDILIWGSVRKSKGVLDFLEYISRCSPDLKILVVGKFSDNNYLRKVLECVKGLKGIVIENRFIHDEELYDLHSLAKRILFIYNGPSVLNSGALIKSLPSGRQIIGPNRGAFKDYKDLGLIDTFDTFEDVLNIARAPFRMQDDRLSKLKASIDINTWERFGERIKEMVL